MLRHHRIISNSTCPLQLRSASDTIRHCRTGCPIHLEQPSQQACGEATKRGPPPPRLRIRTQAQASLQSVAGGSSSFILLISYRTAALQKLRARVNQPQHFCPIVHLNPPVVERGSPVERGSRSFKAAVPRLPSRPVLRKRREGVVPYLPTLSHSDLCRLFLSRLVCLSTVRLARHRQTVSGPEDPPFPSHPPFPLDWAALPIPSPSPHGS